MKRQQKWLLTALVKPLTLESIRSPWWRPTSSLCRLISTGAEGSGVSGGGVAVKKVTRSNFKSTLEQLRLLVRESDFVAFDLEMTGVTSAPWRESFVFDDSDVQYLKFKDSAEKFAVVQFGICPFRWDPAKESFVASPHNFYIFPRKELPVDCPSCEFLCQTSSIDFLAKHQFDFNAYVHDGISYLSRAEETEALRILSSAFQIDTVDASTKSVEIPLVRTADIIFSERMKNIFTEWRNGILDGSLADRIANHSKPQLETVFFKERPAVLLDGLNSHQYKLIQRVIKKHFRDLVYVRTCNETLLDKRIVVYSASEDDKTLLMEKVQEDLRSMNKEKISYAIGFRHVIDLLASENKLLVGHSCILDIAHIHSKFFGPLPKTMTKFAASLHEYFPRIIDTKHLLKGSDAVQRLMEKRSKSLSSVFSVLCPEISISSSSCLSACHQLVRIETGANETGSSWNSGAKHEAGYDAFMTGCVFVQTCSYLGIDFKLQQSVLELSENEKLQKHINLLYPNWKSEAALDLKTGTVVPNAGDQCSSDRKRYSKINFDNIVLIWGFSPNITAAELKACISKGLGSESVASVFFLDNTAALVQFDNRELAAKFLLLKDTLERNNNVVSVVHPFSTLLDGGNTCAADYAIYKEICSSPLSKVLFAEQAKAVGIRWMTKLMSDKVEVKKIVDSITEESSGIDGSVEKPISTFVVKEDERKDEFSAECSLNSILDSLFSTKTLAERETTT